VLRLIRFNTSNRVWYVGQMLDATNALATAFEDRR
jgi:hypothetical protein